MSSSLIVLGALSMIAPSPSRANAYYCGSNLVIFGYVATQAPEPLGNVDVAAINENALVCKADSSDTIYDTRFINPGSNAISIRELRQLDPSVKTLTAVINGLGFNQQTVTLSRVTTQQGATYESDLLTIPAGPAAAGSITATIALPAGVVDATAYHTIGS